MGVCPESHSYLIEKSQDQIKFSLRHTGTCICRDLKAVRGYNTFDTNGFFTPARHPLVISVLDTDVLICAKNTFVYPTYCCSPYFSLKTSHAHNCIIVQDTTENVLVLVLHPCYWQYSALYKADGWVITLWHSDNLLNCWKLEAGQASGFPLKALQPQGQYLLVVPSPKRNSLSHDQVHGFFSSGFNLLEHTLS